MIKHVCQNACFEGARLGTLPGFTESDTEAKVVEILGKYMVKGAIADATYDPATGASTVNISIPVNGNFTLGRAFFKDKHITSEMTLVQ